MAYENRSGYTRDPLSQFPLYYPHTHTLVPVMNMFPNSKRTVFICFPRKCRCFLCHVALILTFYTSYGFNLGAKKWSHFLVEELTEVVFDENAWDHLVLDEDIKVNTTRS